LRRPPIRAALDRIALRLPVIGSFILQQETARFALTLGTLLKSGVPLLQAASSGHNVIRNTRIGSQIERAMGAVGEGSPLHRALVHETNLPPLALRMIATGEEAGKLDRMLLRVATVFEQSTRRTLERAMTLLAPALTMIIAAFVGGLSRHGRGDDHEQSGILMHPSRHRDNGAAGFTMIELLVALSIVVLVASVAMPYMRGHTTDRGHSCGLAR
jgi:prepilin-type N-terminal cleavage/methylation domain-containing protein